MAGRPVRNRSVQSAVSQSGRATYEISRRSSPTAITSATSITEKCPFLHSNIMRWHHDKPRDNNGIESPGRGSLSRHHGSFSARRSQDSASPPLLADCERQAWRAMLPLGLDPFKVRDGVLSIVVRRIPSDLKEVLFGNEYVSGVLTPKKSFS